MTAGNAAGIGDVAVTFAVSSSRAMRATVQFDAFDVFRPWGLYISEACIISSTRKSAAGQRRTDGVTVFVCYWPRRLVPFRCGHGCLILRHI